MGAAHFKIYKRVYPSISFRCHKFMMSKFVTYK